MSPAGHSTALGRGSGTGKHLGLLGHRSRLHLLPLPGTAEESVPLSTAQVASAVHPPSQIRTAPQSPTSPAAAATADGQKL